MRYISSLSSPLLTRPGKRNLAILGSTGSIGRSALRVVAKNSDLFRVIALAGARNIELLARQAMDFRPAYLAVLDENRAKALTTLLPSDYNPQILVGSSGYTTLATLDKADLVLAAQVGAAGLVPALAAAKAGKILCLANKEALVLAGHLFRQTCDQSGAVVLPVDSEHNALFQAMAGHDISQIKRLILTASGGPFHGKSAQDIAAATPETALKHPNWSMGAKISIDSATMMNKGLEIIEAVHLYGASPDTIDVVVHPQSIVHSLIEYQDGSHLAQLGIADMELPISYCLGYPRRLCLDLEPLDLIPLGSLNFEAPDETRFPCLRLAREALVASPSHPVVLNAANEVAVQAFLNHRLSLPGLARLVEHVLETHNTTSVADLDSILALDALTRERCEQAITEAKC